tara:strand:- start:80 stop:559 length:480 start_codon:yes stop_codon:yes gene_type:complete
MANFAEIKEQTDPTGITTDTQWIVQRVVVVGDDVVSSDMAPDGEQWCQNFFGGGVWKQTSYNSNFRVHFAGVNYVFSFDKNAFIKPQPFASWTLENTNLIWQPPIATPPPVSYIENDQECYYERDWDEDLYQTDNTKGWIARGPNDAMYVWNGSEYVSE